MDRQSIRFFSLCRWKATRQPRASALPRGSWECFLACLRSWTCFLQKGFLCMMRREVAWLASAPLPLKLLRSPLPLLGKLLGTGTACYSLRTQTVPDQVVVMEAHVERAWALTEILLKMREVWCKFEADGMALSELPSPPADFFDQGASTCIFACQPHILSSYPAGCCQARSTRRRFNAHSASMQNWQGVGQSFGHWLWARRSLCTSSEIIFE